MDIPECELSGDFGCHPHTERCGRNVREPDLHTLLDRLCGDGTIDNDLAFPVEGRANSCREGLEILIGDDELAVAVVFIHPPPAVLRLNRKAIGAGPQAAY